MYEIDGVRLGVQKAPYHDLVGNPGKGMEYLMMASLVEFYYGRLTGRSIASLSGDPVPSPN